MMKVYLLSAPLLDPEEDSAALVKAESPSQALRLVERPHWKVLAAIPEDARLEGFYPENLRDIAWLKGDQLVPVAEHLKPVLEWVV